MVERGEHGKLKKGSVLNPRGRPKKEREHTYLEIMLTTVSIDNWRDIVIKAKLNRLRRVMRLPQMAMRLSWSGEPEHNVTLML